MRRLPKLFTTLVRAHLEYGNIIWHPWHRIDKLEIEKIQRPTTKLIPRLKHLPHEERLQALILPSLDFRRRRGYIIQVFKIMDRLDRLDPDIFFLRAEGPCTSHQGHKDKLLTRHSWLEARKNVFSQRIVQNWNSLSEGTIAATTLNIFKVPGNGICGTIGVKSGIPNSLSLIFRILVSCFFIIITAQAKLTQNLGTSVTMVPTEISYI